MGNYHNFDLHMYTDIVFGRGTVERLPELVRKYGGTKVLFVYGSGSIKRNGLYDRIVSALGGAGIPFVEFGGVKANPLRSHAEKGMEIARAEGTDFYLGVGGGSSIDTAKSIALAMANDGEYWPFYCGIAPKRMAPVGVVNTIAASGSETSGSSVLVDDIDGTGKHGNMWPDVSRPSFAILDPELTYSVPPRQTAAGSADIFAHTYMRFFSRYDSFLGDEFCIGLLRTVAAYAAAALARPDDYEARAELMLGAAFAHNDLTGIGRPYGMMGGEHGLERQLSGYYDFPHGEGLAVVMPAYLKYMAAHGDGREVGRVAKFGARVFDAPIGADDRATAEEGIRRFTEWLRSLGLPTTLGELGVPEGEMDVATERCVEDNNGLLKGFMDVDAGGMREIFASAR